jgi:DNA-binding SARP family transcriptional activator
MRFRLLGALEIGLQEGTVARLGGPRQRTVLAALLLRANDVASIGYLTRAAWEHPPAAPESNLRTYVAGLRRTLREAGEDSTRLATRSNGYSLAVRPGELDMAQFENLAARGARNLRTYDFAGAVECLRAALGLWCGQPLEGLALGPVLRAEVARLQERRFTVVEQYCQASLELGQFGELAGELRWLVSEHPLREDLCAQLMSALHRSGRRAEALEVFRQARERLVRDLGIEPCRLLQSAQEEILTAPAHAPRALARASRPTNPRRYRRLSRH